MKETIPSLPALIPVRVDAGGIFKLSVDRKRR